MGRETILEFEREQVEYFFCTEYPFEKFVNTEFAYSQIKSKLETSLEDFIKEFHPNKNIDLKKLFDSENIKKTEELFKNKYDIFESYLEDDFSNFKIQINDWSKMLEFLSYEDIKKRTIRGIKDSTKEYIKSHDGIVSIYQLHPREISDFYWKDISEHIIKSLNNDNSVNQILNVCKEFSQDVGGDGTSAGSYQGFLMNESRKIGIFKE
jgi:hypothetical protein